MEVASSTLKIGVMTEGEATEQLTPSARSILLWLGGRHGGMMGKMMHSSTFNISGETVIIKTKES